MMQVQPRLQPSACVDHRWPHIYIIMRHNLHMLVLTVATATCAAGPAACAAPSAAPRHIVSTSTGVATLCASAAGLSVPIMAMGVGLSKTFTGTLSMALLSNFAGSAAFAMKRLLGGRRTRLFLLLGCMPQNVAAFPVLWSLDFLCYGGSDPASDHLLLRHMMPFLCSVCLVASACLLVLVRMPPQYIKSTTKPRGADWELRQGGTPQFVYYSRPACPLPPFRPTPSPDALLALALPHLDRNSKGETMEGLRPAVHHHPRSRLISHRLSMARSPVSATSKESPARPPASTLPQVFAMPTCA